MDWETPDDLFSQLDSEFHFTLDPASSDSNAKCPNHYTEADDGLSRDWGGQTVFCNPPYGRELPKWVEKCASEARKPNTTVVMLIPSRTDTRWFHTWLYGKAEIRFLKGRVKFESNHQSQGPAPFPSMVCILGKENK
jgi:phage N-6-adenine-methyltransferase